ncbi:MULTISPECIES: hypothetical protein [Salinibaculum]|uniref:hypothetical protein n=1 Tax=Salinibaculum TaxID=2732368 RepID=UPI0030CDDE12
MSDSLQYSRDETAANEERAVMIPEVAGSVTRLSGERSATAGGRDSVTATGPDGVSILGDLPEDMPEFVTDTLSNEQLREGAIGTLDPADLL